MVRMKLVLSRCLNLRPRGRGASLRVLAGASLLLAAMSGCVSETMVVDSAGQTTSTTTSAPNTAVNSTAANQLVAANGNSGDTSPRPDLVTASDETDAAKRSRIRLELATAYFSQGQASTALDEVKRALVANPSSVPAYNLRALIYASMGEQALADDSFRRALAIQPLDPDLLHNHGWYQCNLKRYAEARTEFNTALAQPQYRDRAKTSLALGVCEARSGDFEAAEKSLLRSFELDAGNPATAVNLSEVLLHRGDLERARFYAQRVNAVPEYANAETLWLAARIEHRRGNTEGVEGFGTQLKARYPGSRQTIAFEQGKFNE
jgi:type IV pilus assembly protein PilF